MELINANTDGKKPDIFTISQDIANIDSPGDFPEKVDVALYPTGIPS